MVVSIVASEVSACWVSAPVPSDGCSELVFDVRDTMHAVEGFGVQVWADQPHGLAELLALNMSYIRITDDHTSLGQLESLRASLPGSRAKWLYMLWRAPKQYVNERNQLEDVAGFAVYWRDLVAELDRCGIRPHYIELMNEPDSDGSWSTRIAPADYASLVRLTRIELDWAGFADVGIVGPGLAHLNWNHHSSQWINALDGAAASLAAWSTHCWDDGDLCFGGAACVDRHWPEFGNGAKRLGADKSIWITEYGTKELRFGGAPYPHPDETGGFSSAQSMPYAVRVYELSLALLNKGANVLFYWHAEDMGKSWGFVDANGKHKPVYHVLRSLFPEIPKGARVVRPPDQSAAGVYGAAFIRKNRLTIALANDGPSAQNQVVRLKGVSSVPFLWARACVTERRGDPRAEEPDTCRVVYGGVDIKPGNWFDATLPGFSTLTIVCLVERESSEGGRLGAGSE